MINHSFAARRAADNAEDCAAHCLGKVASAAYAAADAGHTGAILDILNYYRIKATYETALSSADATHRDTNERRWQLLQILELS